MAHHRSAIKNIRSDATRRLRYRYQLKSCRTLIKKLKATTDKKEAMTLFQEVTSRLDKLAKKRIIHPNKSANSKAKLARRVQAIS